MQADRRQKRNALHAAAGPVSRLQIKDTEKATENVLSFAYTQMYI